MARPTPTASWDVALAAAWVVAAAASSALPSGGLRMMLGVGVLLFAPGYLLLQALIVPAARGVQRAWQCLAALGLSPALVGVLALSTAIVQGGFRLGAIVALVTVGSLALAGAALVRRRAVLRVTVEPRVAPRPAPSPARLAGPTAPGPAEAARAKSGTARP